MEREGVAVTYLTPDNTGLISPRQVREALRETTVLVSLMYANNEIGSIQPIDLIGKELLKWRKTQNSPYPFFHSDASQATNYLSLDVEKLHVDLMSFNAAKMYGPKGVGVLFKRRGVACEPVLFGGGQEHGLRSGTEYVSGIVGLGEALNIAFKKKEDEVSRLRSLQTYFWNEVQKNISDVRLHGPGLGEETLGRLPNNLSISFLGAEGEALVLYLDRYGIQCATGSACKSRSDDGSHVLKALGASQDEINSSIRFSFGRDTTKKTIDYVMRYLPAVVGVVRQMNSIE